jgi:hypothetical protein
MIDTACLDNIAYLRDPDSFYYAIQREARVRVPNVPLDNRQAAIYIMGFLKNPSYMASVVNTRVHNDYMFASAWQLIYQSLRDLQEEYGLTDATIRNQLTTSERMRSLYLALYDTLNKLVESAGHNFSVLAMTNPYYASYFKKSDFHEAQDNDVMFDVQKLKETGRSFVDSIIMEICFPNSTYPKYVLLQILHDAVKECPREAKRFPQELWDAMGELSTLVSFREIIEAPFFGPEGEKIKGMSFQPPSDYEQWLDAQLYSLEATKDISFKDILNPLERTKTVPVLESLWKSINQNYLAASGMSIDDLWGLEGALDRTPQWNAFYMPTAGVDDSDIQGRIGGRKKPLAITQHGGGFDEDSDSMPGLQSVSNSSDDDEDSDYDDSDEEEDDESDASGYDTDHEDQLRDLFREAMEMHQEWAFHDREGIHMEQDSSNKREDKNPFLKLLGSLRGRMFKSEPKVSATGPKMTPATKRGFFSRKPPARKTGGPPSSTTFPESKPKAPTKTTTATTPRGVMMEEVEDEDEDIGTSKKKKKKKPKKKKKKTTQEEQPILERVATPPPASPPPTTPPTSPPTKGKTKSKASPAPKPKPNVNTNQAAPTFNIPLETTTAQSAHSYLKDLETPKQKVKTRSDTASIFSQDKEKEEKKGIKSWVSSVEFTKKVVDETQTKAKKSFFSALNKKTVGLAQLLVRGNPEKGRASMKWEEFESFMTKMGFTVDHSTAGSSVRFDPPNPNDRSITFHKPHPDSSLDHHKIKIFGRRLRDYYGWDEEDLAGLL